METTYSRFKKVLKKYKISFKEEAIENDCKVIGIENKENFSIDCMFEEGSLKEIVKNKWVHNKANYIDFIGIKNNNYEFKFYNDKELLGQLNLNLKTKEVEFA